MAVAIWQVQVQEMLLGFIRRQVPPRAEEIARLDLAQPINWNDWIQLWKSAVAEAGEWINGRPSSEAGCLYLEMKSGKFHAPQPGEESNHIMRLTVVLCPDFPTRKTPASVSPLSYRKKPPAFLPAHWHNPERAASANAQRSFEKPSHGGTHHHRCPKSTSDSLDASEINPVAMKDIRKL